MEKIPAFCELMRLPKKVVIVTHFKPDADALGSSLGLAAFLQKKGHAVRVVTPSDYPAFLSWMPGNGSVHAVVKENQQQLAEASRLIHDADVVFCLDFSVLNRINSLGEMVRKAPAVKVMIDHHLEPERFADFEFWDVTSASTAGLVFELIQHCGETHLIDQTIATCLYAGLMTDTGGFRHNNTTAREFRIAAHLTESGAQPHEIARLIYDSNSLERLRLTGYVLSQKLTVLPEYQTAYMLLTADELTRFGAQTGDTEGLVNYGLSIQGIRLSVLMYDRKEEIKLSFRSLGGFSVNEFARRHFNGGGHHNAAGGSSRLSLAETLRRFLELLPDYQEALNRP
jgi:phosphoesterase RecJ-like protein